MWVGVKILWAPFQNQWQTLSFPHRVSRQRWHLRQLFYFFCMFNHDHKWHPLGRLASATSQRPFHHSTLIVLRLGCLALRWGMARGERNLARGKPRGVEETAKTVKERAKGLYRKSITLFQFFRHLAAERQSQGLSAGGTIQAFFPPQVNFISSLLQIIWCIFSRAGTSTGG